MTPRTEIGISEARDTLAEVVGRVRYGGARIVLTSNKKQAAALISLDDLKLLELIEDRAEDEWAAEAIEAARREGGEPVSAEDVFADLGL